MGTDSNTHKYSDKVKSAIEDHKKKRKGHAHLVKRQSLELVALRGFTPLRQLFLELAEKLSAILEHRMRMAGDFDYVEDDDADDSGAFTEDSDLDDEELSESVNGIDGVGEGEGGPGSDEDVEMGRGIEQGAAEGTGQGPWDRSVDGSEGDESPDEDFADELFPSTDEQKATWLVNGVLDQAEKHADQRMFVDGRGCNRVFNEEDKKSAHLDANGSRRILFHTEKSSVLSFWVVSNRNFRTWMRRLRHGCAGLLEYNPIHEAIYELVIGWNIASMPSYAPTRAEDLINAARVMKVKKDAAAVGKTIQFLSAMDESPAPGSLSSGAASA